MITMPNTNNTIGARELFILERRMIADGKKHGWTHTPDGDRYISDLMQLTFEKKDNDGKAMRLSVIFDLNNADCERNAVARMKTQCGTKEVKASDLSYYDILLNKALFNPMTYVYHGKWVE